MRITSFNAFTLCFGLIVITLQLLLFYFYCSFLKQKNHVYKWHKSVDFLTCITLGMYTLHSIQLVFSIFTFNSTLESKLGCETLALLSGLLYHGSKGCLYGLIIAKIQVAYSNASHGYSLHNVILLLYCVLFGYFIVFAFADYIEMTSNYWDVSLLSCYTDTFEISIGTLTVIVLDIALTIACITLILLLILSMKKKEFKTSTVDINNIDVNCNGNSNNSQNKNNTTIDINKTYRINSQYQFSIYKQYCRLIFISLISTAMALAFYLISDIYLGDNNGLIPYFSVFVILLNNAINVICIFLFDDYDENDNLYKKICLHQFCRLCQFCQTDSTSNSKFNVRNILDKHVKHISSDTNCKPQLQLADGSSEVSDTTDTVNPTANMLADDEIAIEEIHIMDMVSDAIKRIQVDMYNHDMHAHEYKKNDIDHDAGKNLVYIHQSPSSQLQVPQQQLQSSQQSIQQSLQPQSTELRAMNNMAIGTSPTLFSGNRPHIISMSDSQLPIPDIIEQNNTVPTLKLSDAFGSNQTTDSKTSRKFTMTNILPNMQNKRNTVMSAMSAMTAMTSTAITALSAMTPTAQESRYV